jgi:hypothetical protein
MELEIENEYMMHRMLRGPAQHAVPSEPAWKSALWETNSIEPAMLRAPLLIIIFLFMWVCNVLILENSRVQYFKALNLTKGNIFPLILVSTVTVFIYFKQINVSKSIFFLLSTAPTYVTVMLASTLLCVYAITITISAKMTTYGITVSMAIFYAVLFVLAVVPGVPWAEERRYWLRFMKQIILPVGPIAFKEIMFADALCSMSKVFKDFGVTAVAIYAMYAETAVVDYHNSAMIFIAVLASIPFW